ncbi:hypothetical protein AND_008630 [Anopheles darlingi]|uniref:Uncharacterized protein n=1 Tax=Anopheles darlingi TaxID=43151 RepID=W5JA85_ANODA|nr:hypothetical protein AND_008630 [Anopheles darlingi]
MRIVHHPGRAVDASLSLEQRSAMGALYEANWNKVQSSMNALIESEAGSTSGATAAPDYSPHQYRTSVVAGSSEDDEGLPDEEERDTFQEGSGVLKALNGYRPATIRRARRRQYPEWDELKEQTSASSTGTTQSYLEDLGSSKYHTVRGRMFENTHKPRPPLRGIVASGGGGSVGLSASEFDTRAYRNRSPEEGDRQGRHTSTLKRSNTVAAHLPSTQHQHQQQQRTLDRREMFLLQQQQQHQQHQQQPKKERIRQQKPIDEYSDHQRPVVNVRYPGGAVETTCLPNGAVDKLESKLRSSTLCDSSNGGSSAGARYRDKSSPAADYRRGSDDSESNLSIGDRMTTYRSDNDLCSQIYREGSRNGSLASIPRATATLSRNKTIKGRPILEDIPADLLPRLEPEKPKKSGSKKVGFGKMLYNTISAGTKFPRTLLKSHFQGSPRDGDTSEYESITTHGYNGLESPLSSSGASSSASSPSASKSSSFKKLFGGGRNAGTPSRSGSSSSSSSNGGGGHQQYPGRQQYRASSTESVESFIVPTGRGSSGPGGPCRYPSLVPVHTYARKRRTGNLITSEPIYGNVEEIYATPDDDDGPSVPAQTWTTRNLAGDALGMSSTTTVSNGSDYGITTVWPTTVLIV